MATIAWDEAQPSNTSNAGLADDELRSLKSALATGLGTDLFWPGSGGGSAASAGEMRPGKARAYFGTESQVSGVTSGALMVTSDTSRLFGLTSGGTVFLGSSRAVEYARFTGPNSRTVICSGVDAIGSIAFGVEYDITPVVILSAETSASTVGVPYMSSVTRARVTVDVKRVGGGAFGSGWSIHWTSIGTLTY